MLVALLGAVFLKGFKEAIGIAVGLVSVYLVLNLIVVGDALYHVILHPPLVIDWRNALFAGHGSPLAMIGYGRPIRLTMRIAEHSKFKTRQGSRSLSRRLSIITVPER